MTLMLAGAYVYLAYKQPVYKIQASLLVQDEKKGNEQGGLLKEMQAFASKQVVENEIEILRSFTLMERVVERLRLDVAYYHASTFGHREVYGNTPIELVIEKPNEELYKTLLEVSFPNTRTIKLDGQIYPLNIAVQTPYGILRFKNVRAVSDTTQPLFIWAMKRASAVNGYVRSLKAEPTSKSSTVIVLSLEDAVPAKGEAILNQLISEYNQAAVQDKNLIAANTLNFIDERLAILSGELANAESAVETYKSREGITDLSSQAQSFLQTVQQNDASLNQVNVQLAVLNDLQAYINKQSDQPGSAPATVGLNDPVLLSLVEKVNQLELQKEQLSRTTSSLNPLLQTLDSQIKSLKDNIAENIQTMRQMLLSSKQQYTAKNNQVEHVIRTIPRQERSLMNVTRQQAIKNNLYTYLLQKREETAVSYASSISDSRTIDRAQSGDVPVKPVKLMIYGMFGLLGMIIPFSVIAGRSLLSNRVSQQTDVEETTQIPIAGELMHKKQASFIVDYKQPSIISEQFRTLRASIRQLENEPRKSHVLLFTSSISGEGKSFASLNIGASLALVGLPTVILEMDLRRPTLPGVYNMDQSPGISDYLLGEASFFQILKQVPGYENYFMVPSGSSTANPAELLSSSRLSQLLNELREHFTYILIDTPPVGIVSDARLIAPLVDATYFMVRPGITPKNYLKQINSLRKEKRFPQLSIIMNAVDDDQNYQYSKAYYVQAKSKSILPRNS
ncbi:GumC family protein [Spirosoma taeanense]|uniref:GumC family protein n=1 Tax=Spirosoma taeanense TaxID=2735870 RepID=UPI001F044C0F|nr:polysaccharide biosynthesis tyrosine autokinase [Spirosoma taeanense]